MSRSGRPPTGWHDADIGYAVEMQTGARQGRAVSLLLSSHPGPSLAVTAITLLLSVAVGLDGWRIGVVTAAVLLGQLSVGLGNDWCDADRDRRARRRDKPVAGGRINPNTVLTAAVITGILGLALPLAVGLQAATAHSVFVAAGWLYNLGLKKSVLSLLPYLVGFGSLPAVATLALASPRLPALWVIGAGALLGTAAHFVNALPDLDADLATGIIGLPHRLGSRVSSVITFGALAGSSALIVASSARRLDIASLLLLSAEGAIVAVGIFLGLTRAPSRWLFRLVILGAITAVATLALTGTKMIAT